MTALSVLFDRAVDYNADYQAVRSFDSRIRQHSQWTFSKLDKVRCVVMKLLSLLVMLHFGSQVSGEIAKWLKSDGLVQHQDVVAIDLPAGFDITIVYNPKLYALALVQKQAR